ncbi:MAG TPA: protein kinase, partial [Thermoanaerobaculia bacterium]|nr:protein kinase [Thermoanaerobaculia bacterium]
MRRLLAAAEAEDSRLPLGGALWEELAASAGGELAAGMRLGAYRILRELGRGGMARVYLAERADDQFDQQVALKILERPADDAQAVARFHRERQILARLEHPNIARILDGGLAPNGRPYFVLELVDEEHF